LSSSSLPLLYFANSAAIPVPNLAAIMVSVETTRQTLSVSLTLSLKLLDQ